MSDSTLAKPRVSPAVAEQGAAQTGRTEAARSARPRRWGLITVLGLAAIYLPLQNGRWVSGTDTALYLTLARNMLSGKGFSFNGGPIGSATPLWPLMLAGVMKVSASFWVLNLVPMLLMLGSGALWYAVLRRLLSPAKACASVLLSGVLFFSYASAVQLRTEGVFCFVVAAGVLVGLQVSEGRGGWWRVPLLMILCVAMVCIRWAGVGAWFVVAAAMVNGQARVSRNRQWLGMAATLLATVIGFVELRYIMSHVLGPGPNTLPITPDVEPQDFPGIGGDAGDAPGIKRAPITGIMSDKGLLAMGEFIVSSGNWMSSLLWMPMYLGVTNRMVGLATNLFGWGLLALCWMVIWRDGRRRQWLWIGVALYCLAIVVRCGLPNPRYCVPVAPLLVGCLWLGLDHAAELAPNWRRFWRAATALLLVSIAACNLVLWGIDVYITQLPGFYGRYHAGEVGRLLAAAEYLSHQDVKDGEIAVSASYVNLGRNRPNGEGLRSLCMLTDRGVRYYYGAEKEKAAGPTTSQAASTRPAAGKAAGGKPAAAKAAGKIAADKAVGPPDEWLIKWAAANKVKYYLYRPPVSPWRALHFKVAWLQRMLTHQKNIPDNPSWLLYRIENGKAIPVELPDVVDWPRRVPAVGE